VSISLVIVLLGGAAWATTLQSRVAEIEKDNGIVHRMCIDVQFIKYAVTGEKPDAARCDRKEE
jgi:hypothetical protein